jgi:hypothetical protein
MKPTVQRARNLRLEMLETRTLLAGTGFDKALAEVSPAIKGTGDFSVSFSERIGQSEIFITGSNLGTVTINFDTLPSFVTAVTVKNFDTVTFSGTDSLQKLVASDIKVLDAKSISVSTGLYATNVGSVSLATGGEIAVLSGTASKLDIARLDTTLIISDLQRLSVSSVTPTVSIVSLNSTQMVTMLYQAELVSVAGLADSSKQVQTLIGGETPSSAPNVLTLQPNERTNLFIARIRELLRSNSGLNPLSFIESLDRLDAHLALDSASAAAHLHFLPDHGLVASPTPLTTGDEFSVSIDSIPLIETIDSAPIFTSIGGAEIDNPAMADDTIVVTTAEFGPDFADGMVAPSTDRSERHGDILVTSEAQELFMETLQRDARTLKDIVIEGISAEITPGERTAFLLVDPKPMRNSSDRNRESTAREGASVFERAG